MNNDKFTGSASSIELIADSLPIVEDFFVTKVEYSEHRKEGKPPSMKVTYHCGKLQSFHEYVLFEYDGYPRKRACDWWRLRSNTEPPPTTELALMVCQMLPIPKTIKVHVNSKHRNILNYGF